MASSSGGWPLFSWNAGQAGWGTLYLEGSESWEFQPARDNDDEGSGLFPLEILSDASRLGADGAPGYGLSVGHVLTRAPLYQLHMEEGFNPTPAVTYTGDAEAICAALYPPKRSRMGKHSRSFETAWYDFDLGTGVGLEGVGLAALAPPKRLKPRGGIFDGDYTQAVVTYTGDAEATHATLYPPKRAVQRRQSRPVETTWYDFDLGSGVGLEGVGLADLRPPRRSRQGRQSRAFETAWYDFDLGSGIGLEGVGLVVLRPPRRSRQARSGTFDGDYTVAVTPYTGDAEALLALLYPPRRSRQGRQSRAHETAYYLFGLGTGVGLEGVGQALLRPPRRARLTRYTKIVDGDYTIQTVIVPTLIYYLQIDSNPSDARGIDSNPSDAPEVDTGTRVVSREIDSNPSDAEGIDSNPSDTISLVPPT